MHRPAITTALGLLLGLGAGCSAPHAPVPSEAQAAAVRDGVQATLDAHRAYSAAGQWEALAGLYVDDPSFRWVERGTVAYRSVAEIRKALVGLPAGTRIETTFQDTEITPVAPGVASVVTQFQTRFSAATGGGFGFAGAMTMTLVQRDGGWRILGGHASSAESRGP